MRRRDQFGNIPKGTSGEKIGIAAASWRDLYPPERRLSGLNEDAVQSVVAAAINPDVFKTNLRALRDGTASQALVASGGLCAPTTPYYALQMIAQSMRPVRSALPAFNADRGGIRFGRPASIADIDTAVGIITATNDAAGGTFATKSCQRIDCPPFSEVDVDTIYHCLEFGNLGARTYPELVAQWNSLVVAAQARVAEANLLTSIDAASTQVTAGDIGLGATGALLGQILAAAEGMRNRHRMDPEAVLRFMAPEWLISLLISDVIRGQFERRSRRSCGRSTSSRRSTSTAPTGARRCSARRTRGRCSGSRRRSPGTSTPRARSCSWTAARSSSGSCATPS